MMWCDNEDKCPEGKYTMSFMESLASLLPDSSQFNCVVYVIHFDHWTAVYYCLRETNFLS